jgi:hypothetical protein
LSTEIPGFRSVVDPDPDPAFQVNPVPDLGYDDKKLGKRQQKKNLYFFLLKIAICISLGLLKGHPSNM